MKPTNRDLLSLPERQTNPVSPTTASLDSAEHEVGSVVPHTTPPIEPETSVALPTLLPTLVPIAQPEPLPVIQLSVSPYRSKNLAWVLLCTNLVLVAYFIFIARSHLELEPLAVSGLRPLPEISVPPTAPSEPFYNLELAFPFRETAISFPKLMPTRHQEPAKLKIGVYKQESNVEKWRRWARQQNVAFEVVTKSHNGESHYSLYLYDHDPVRIDKLKIRVAEISGEPPQLIGHVSSIKP